VVGAGAGGPHQGDGFGQVADIVVGPGEQLRVRTLGGELADEAGLGGGEGEIAGNRGEADAAVGIGLGRKVAAQQRDLRVARGREDEAFEQVGEGDQASSVPTPAVR